MLKLVIHVPVSEQAKVGVKMGINFLKTKTGEERLEARLLFNAQGVTKILEEDQEFLELLEAFHQGGGEVYFCENALRAFGVPREKLPSLARTVPAGIRALVEWQEEGFRYVRA